MDDTDRQLIALLRNDARASVASLAKSLGVARGTVQNRMARLTAAGTIVGYTVRLKPDIEEQRMRAFMTVAVEGNQVDGVIRAMRGEPAVAALYSTNLDAVDVVAEAARWTAWRASTACSPASAPHRGHLADGDQLAAVDVQVLSCAAHRLPLLRAPAAGSPSSPAPAHGAQSATARPRAASDPGSGSSR